MTGTHNRYGLIRTGEPRAPGRLGRPCPKCKAAAGHRCGRWSADGYIWTPSEKIHSERRASDATAT